MHVHLHIYKNFLIYDDQLINRLIFFCPQQIEMMVVRTIKPPNITNCTAPSSGDWGADGLDKNPGEPNWWVGTGAAAHQSWV